MQQVRLIPAAQVAGAEAGLHQDAGGDVPPLADLAVRHDRPVLRKFAEAAAEAVHRQVDRAGDVPVRELFRRPHVEQERLGGRRDRLPIHLRVVAAEQPAGHEPGHVHRVFRRAELRGVAQFHLFEVERGHPGLDRHRQHVDPLVHPGPPDALRAEQLARVRIEDHLERHPLRTGVVAGVVGRVDVHLAERPALALQRLLGPPGHRRRLAEQADDGRPLRPAVRRVPAEGVVGGDAALAVGRPRERNLGPLPGGELVRLDGIPDREDVRVAGLEALVDPDSAPRPDFKSGLDRQRVLGPHPHAEHDQLGGAGVAGRKRHRHTVRAGGDRRGGLPEEHLDARFGQGGEQGGGHLRVERGQHLPVAIEDRRGDPAADEVLDHLQADEPGPDDDGPADAAVHRRLDAVGVGERPEGEDVREVGPRNRRADRGRTGGEDELVVRLVVDPARGQVADADRLPVPVDGLHVGPRPHVQAEPLAEPLGGGDEELVPPRDDLADVVRQAAVGEGDVRPPLEQHDVRAFGQAAGAGRRGGSPGDAADDDEFHDTPPAAEGVGHVGDTRFHGIRASTRPMPQVSVTPAKTSPAPTNADRPRNPGWTR